MGLEGGINLFTYANENPLIQTDILGLYVSGIGIGASGAIEIQFKIGVGGSVSGMAVFDDKGNSGFVACASGGVAISSGFIIGLQTSHLWGVESVCDLGNGGFSISVGGGFAEGAGIAGDIGASGLNVITGVGYGKWGASIGLLSGCKLIESTCCKEKTLYRVNPDTGKTIYRVVLSGTDERYYYKIPR